MNPETVDAMVDAVMMHPSFGGLATAGNSAFTSAITQSVIVNWVGTARIVTRSRLDQATLPTIKTIDIEKLIVENAEKQQDAEAAVAALLRDRQSLADGDPRVAPVDKELAIVREEQEKAGKEVDEAKEMRNHAEHEKEREEEVSTREGEGG